GGQVHEEGAVRIPGCNTVANRFRQSSLPDPTRAGHGYEADSRIVEQRDETIQIVIAADERRQAATTPRSGWFGSSLTVEGLLVHQPNRFTLASRSRSRLMRLILRLATRSAEAPHRRRRVRPAAPGPHQLPHPAGQMSPRCPAGPSFRPAH